MRVIAVVVSLAFTLVSGDSRIAAARDPIRITHGKAAGDVTSNSAVIWARSDRRATMSVRYYPIVGGEEPQTVTAANSAASDFTAKVKVARLSSANRYTINSLIHLERRPRRAAVLPAARCGLSHLRAHDRVRSRLFHWQRRHDLR